MVPFAIFLLEAASEEKLTHLQHAEDHIIDHGLEGFHHAARTLWGIDHGLTKRKTNVNVSTKYDGSPSLVFGTHPESGKFFVATKSAFNKTPKLNFTHADIDKNHESPGLREKLHTALEHLPKVTPHGRVFQGDVMYTHHDLHHDEKGASFQPNTIRYLAKAGTAHHQATKSAKLGIVVHTEYHGQDTSSLKAHYGPNLDSFKSHPSVHVIDPKASNQEYHQPEKEAFRKHMRSAADLAKKTNFGVIKGHEETLKHYINKTVRDNETPSVVGYKQHLDNLYTKKAASYKTPERINSVKQEHHSAVSSIHNNAVHFNNVLKVHSHLQHAKDALVRNLSKKPEFGHFIGKSKAKPEGFVAILNNRPTKLVDRAEFSRANFEMSKNRK